jgi:hypothetical protein
MNKFVLLILSLVLPLLGISQPCLPEGITFTTQEQIDSFPINYAGCTDIEGDVWIVGDSITNLFGLSQIVNIYGDLDIIGNHSLVNLNGLTNLDSIGGSLTVQNNIQLRNLSGLDSLRIISNDLYIGFYWMVTNPLLESLTGLEGLHTIGGELSISHNPMLSDLGPLNNLDTIGGDLTIRHNTNLSICDVQSICNYLSSPNGYVTIHNNATGCNNPPDIASNCGFVMDCLPYGSYFFTNQMEVDSFSVNYPGCTSLNGGAWIEGDMNNLEGLNMVTGMEGLYIVGNSELENLEGLEGLTCISGPCFIGMYLSPYNSALTSLKGLHNLDTIEDALHIVNNPVLSDITALDSLNSTTFNYLEIGDNASLSDCAIKSFCEYLDVGGENTIQYNAPGCNSFLEVISACDAVSITLNDQDILHDLSLAPNPFFISTTLSFRLYKPENLHFTVYNVQSKIVYSIEERRNAGEQQIQWNAEGLPAGLYFYRLVAGDRVASGKLVKVNDK